MFRVAYLDDSWFMSKVSDKLLREPKDNLSSLLWVLKLEGSVRSAS